MGPTFSTLHAHFLNGLKTPLKRGNLEKFIVMKYAQNRVKYLIMNFLSRNVAGRTHELHFQLWVPTQKIQHFDPASQIHSYLSNHKSNQEV
jgi:hypothetical protein